MQRELEESKQIQEKKVSQNEYGIGAIFAAPQKQEAQFLELTEKESRDRMSQMIGDKIIAKIFNDNLKDFISTDDMEPIMNICSIISKVLTITRELDVR